MAEELDNGQLVRPHRYCIANEAGKERQCNSSDALALYEHKLESGEIVYDAFCYSCNQRFSVEEVHKSSLAKDLGIEGGKVVEYKNFTKVPKNNPLSKQGVVDFIKQTGYRDKPYRGMLPEYLKFFGHLAKKDKDGKTIAFYYPETQEGAGVTGYKCRNLPKDFRYGKLGVTGLSCQLAGQVKFPKGGKYVLITAGEIDLVSAYQMLREDQKSRGQGEYDPVAVVSPTTGEPSAYKQVAAQYEFFDSFDIIVVGMDNDDVGKISAQAIAKVLPADKVRIATWSSKDPNKMLEEGKQKQFVRDFYGAKPFISDGVVSSIEADTKIEEELSRPKIPLPAFMKELQDKMAGGIPLGYWVNWIAMTGIGKSTTVNEAIREWVYHSPYKVGILSLELTDAQYMIAMLSREVGCKINLIKDPKEAVAFVQKPEVVEARRHLKETDIGEERFVILDDREGSLSHVKNQISKLIKKHECKLIVIDPINDLFDGSNSDEQADFIKWMKNIIKSGVTFCCVCHVRKGAVSTNKDGKRIMRELTEDDVSGLSLITKSAGANIFLNRDKYAEDDQVRNTTTVTIGKCRWTGLTGNAGKWYYCNKTHTMYDFDEYFGNTDLGITYKDNGGDEFTIDL